MFLKTEKFDLIGNFGSKVWSSVKTKCVFLSLLLKV